MSHSPELPPSPIPMEPYFRAIPGCETFLAAIDAEPDEDVHRLVFADWLEENGHAPRAEFIRLQCESARAADAYQHWPRMQALLSGNRGAWLEGVDDIEELDFSRGMLETMTLWRFIKMTEREQGLLNIRNLFLDNLHATHLRMAFQNPRLQQIISLSSIRLTPNALSLLASAKQFTRLRHLNLNKSLPRTRFGHLLVLPFLSQLRTLQLGGCHLGEETALDLLKLPQFPTQLRRLDLDRSSIGDDVAEAVANSEKLRNLRWLDLSSNDIRGPGGLALARSKTLSKLEYLDLQRNPLSVGSRQELADAKAFPALRYFAMQGRVTQHHTGVGLARVEEWIKQAQYAKPTHLDLKNASLTADALRTLLASPTFDTVTTIDLQRGLVKPDAIQPLFESPKLAQITNLDLSHNQLKPTQIKILAQSPHAVNLRELYLSHNQLNLQAAELLVTSPHLKDLEYLDLATNRKSAQLIERAPRFAELTRTESPGKLQFGFQGESPDNELAMIVARSPYLEEFTHLELSCYRVDESAIVALVTSPHAVNLTHLVLTQSWRLTNVTLRALADSPYLGKVKHLQITQLNSSVDRGLVCDRWPKARFVS